MDSLTIYSYSVKYQYQAKAKILCKDTSQNTMLTSIITILILDLPINIDNAKATKGKIITTICIVIVVKL